MIRIASLVVALVLSASVSAQTFEGEIVYKTTYKSKVANLTDAQLTSMMGSSLEYFIKGDKYLSRTNGTYFQWQLYVPTDNKIYNKLSTSERATQVDASEVTDEIVKIAVKKGVAEVLGHKVDEIVITCKNSVETYLVSSRLAVDPKLFAKHRYGNWYDLLSTGKALPLKWTLDGPQFSLQTVATQIKEGKLDDKLFKLPEEKQPGNVGN